jgi:hypothetical protein
MAWNSLPRGVAAESKEATLMKHSKEVIKEHREHAPWATWKQAEQIAKDHKKKK